MWALDHSGPRLSWTEQETPAPEEGEVLIEVSAAGLNRADIEQRAGRYPPPPGASTVLGLECAGRVVEVGANVSRWHLGDELCALLPGGGLAQFAIAHEEHCLPIPTGGDQVSAAALPEALTTSWLNLRQEAQLQEGESVLIHAGGSGVGTFAIQLCHLWGCNTYVTAGSDAKIQSCIGLGANDGFNRHNDWKEQVGELRFDVILDPVGGPYLEPNLRFLNTKGRLVVIGIMGGRTGPLDMGRLLVKRLQIRGSVLRSRTVQEKATIINELLADIGDGLHTGQLFPVIDRIYAKHQVNEAFDHLASNTTFGKIVLQLSDV